MTTETLWPESRLAADEKLCAEATAGPLEVKVLIAPEAWEVRLKGTGEKALRIAEFNPRAEKDALFYAQARTEFPAALKEIRRLQATLQDMILERNVLLEEKTTALVRERTEGELAQRKAAAFDAWVAAVENGGHYDMGVRFSAQEYVAFAPEGTPIKSGWYTAGQDGPHADCLFAIEVAMKQEASDAT